ncbi:DUF2202 domain-containing protein [Flagellimonas marinaquae]|uniref:DUF2202 domain-containing protein n=1 Tax=Flagellimonas marinaquae TaxID=254955 RepID=UPI0019D2AD16|nr:DUF2202 domain-containing protein [Allomuricauda aquimarina]
MKKSIMILAGGLILITACNKDEGEVVPLTEQEKTDLRFLREEEKLARDVYVYSYNKYGQSIFNNISNSEQSHMNSVLNLLNNYGLTDPVINDAYGVFSNSELQTLYNELTIKSDSSLNKALEVGANIEDLDINDIDIFKKHTTNIDLINVYDNLSCGSRNHLRSFVGQLGSYTPVYISQTEYDAIINSSNEQCGQ